MFGTITYGYIIFVMGLKYIDGYRLRFMFTKLWLNEFLFSDLHLRITDDALTLFKILETSNEQFCDI